MIPGITEVNFPAYATLHEATISFAEMGDRVITARVKIDGDIVPDFESREWSLIYEGEVFVLNTHIPQATKDDTSRNSQIDLTFESFPTRELKRYFFVELSEVEVGTMIVDKYIATLRLNARDFLAAFDKVLEYYFGDAISIEVNASAELSDEIKEVPIEYAYLWDVLTTSLHDVYGLSWRFTQRNGQYIISVGDPAEMISDHIFQYGYSGGLTRVERIVQDTDIYNQLLGRGGEKNIPYRYFKKVDPYNPIWAGDPDACAELENVYFERLMDINFRYYVKGWLRNPNRPVNPAYPVPSTPEPAEIQAHWAYQKGLTDEKFQPVEYVQDLASIAEYGIRQGKLDDNDDIFPTIQGITVPPYGRIDEIVAVGPITDHDSGGGGEEYVNLGDMITPVSFAAGQSLVSHTFLGGEFQVPSNRNGDILAQMYMSSDNSGAATGEYADICSINTDWSSIVAIRTDDNSEHPITSLQGGYTYRLRITIALNKYPSDKPTRRDIGLADVQLRLTANGAAEDNPYTFNVWVKNIWQTAKESGETDLEYMKRVWEPILGDRLGNEAKLIFSDGFMSVSSDYEFTIVDWPVLDRTKSLNGVQSEWRLTLAKSDAEAEATGLYIPSENGPKPIAGDHFFFTGIDMPHIYVIWAERKLNETKQAALDDKACTNPTWAIALDGVRISTLEGNESETLFSQLSVGKVLQLYDPRFTDNYILQLAIRSMTITWREGTVIYPQVDIVLSEEVLGRTYAGMRISPMSLNARMDSMQIQMASVAQMSTRTMASQKTYLSKEHDDKAVGHVQLAAGASFGIYDSGPEGQGASVEPDGHAELDSLTLRKWLEVPELRYNRTEIQIGNHWRAPGGGILFSVYPDTDSNGNTLNTGIAYLKLEEGEIGTIAVDDICMGIFHDGINDNSNAIADADDSKGNFQFSGFYTAYFRITEILGANNSSFRYAIRPTSTRWTQTFHPCAAMHFVAYGNFDGTNHADRQTSRYSTRTYERYLKDVNTWEFSAANVAAQFGDLSNLAALGLTGMTGYSSYINNLYMTGHVEQVDLPYQISAEWNGQNMLAENDHVQMVFKVMYGFEDATSHVASWAIARDSGDAAADATWAQQQKVLNFDGSIILGYSDLGNSGISTLFTVTAVLDDGGATELEYGFTLLKTTEKGADGLSAFLSNVSHIFAAGTTNAEAGSDTFEVVVFRGADKLVSGTDFTIGTPVIAPNTVTPAMMTATVNAQNGTVAVAVTTDLNIPNGTITVPVTVGTETINLTYSWSLALKGSPGQKGDTGAKLNGPTVWATGVDYRDGTTGIQDQVRSDSGKFYICLIGHTSTPATNPDLNPTIGGQPIWGVFSTMDYVASKVILSEKGSIENLVVKELYTEKTVSGQTTYPISIEGNQIAIKDDNGEEKVKITSGALGTSAGSGSSFALSGGSVQASFANHEGSLISDSIVLGTIPAITSENNIVTIPAITMTIASPVGQTGVACEVTCSLYAGGRLLDSIFGSGTFAQKKVSLPVGAASSLHVEISGGIHPTDSETESGSATITAAVSGSGSVAYSMEFTMIASDGSQFRNGTEGFKVTSAGGAKVIQGGVEYNMAGLGVIEGQGLTAPKRIVFCTAYPTTMANDVFYIKVTPSQQ